MYRQYNSKFNTYVMTIFAGEFFISSNNEVISTVLGSCISVCIYDPVNLVGGMNHFMLPEDSHLLNRFDSSSGFIGNVMNSESMRYGINAMDILIGEMQKQGARRDLLKAKIFGGGRVLSKVSHESSVGDKNIDFTKTYLKLENIPVESEDVGSTYGRKIFFLTGTNSVFVKKVALDLTAEKEKSYMLNLKNMKTDMDITIF